MSEELDIKKCRKHMKMPIKWTLELLSEQEGLKTPR